MSLPTQPGWDYLVAAPTGLFAARTHDRAWTVPAQCALAVPNGTRIRIETTRRTAIRCLYIDRRVDAIGDAVRVVSLSPLARELLSYAVTMAPMRLDASVDEALITLLADRLASEPDAPLHLGLPTDSVARQVAASIRSDPAADLSTHLRAANANRRTIERRFVSETRMSLGQWRRRARILAAVDLLANGESVTRSAMHVGYASPSSFVSAFRSELGMPPRAFMQVNGAAAVSSASS